MALKFLSEEWAKAFTEALNASDEFKQTAGNQTVKVQQVVNKPDGEVKYYMDLEGEKIEVGIGEIDGAEATVTQDYDTAVQLFKGETTGTAAFMSGKLKVSGDMMKLMSLQTIQQKGQQIHSSLDVEY